MIATCVYVSVKEEFVDAFINASTKNHNESVKETGNLRFDVIQQLGKKTEFVLYEAYESETAAANHKKTKHYLEWRETVADMMAVPRKGVSHKIICPLD